MGKRPKFKFTFTINEISNIPHTSGFCFIDLTISDSGSTGLSGTFSSLKQFQLPQKESSKPSSATELSTESQASESSASYHASSRNIQVRTSKYKINNFKCHINLKLTCNLKFPFKKKDNMIGNKFLSMRVLYKADKSSKSGAAVELGTLKLNLAEYLNFNESVSAKYLLQESKINSILNLTINLEELPPDFEFHTQLHIDETKQIPTAQNSKLSISKAKDKTNKSFKVPEFSKKGVFGGLDEVINPNSSKASDKNEEISESEDVSFSSSDDNDDNTDSGVSHKNRHVSTVGAKSYDNVIVDPIIGSLFRKLLESFWDPELHSLLKITPQQVIDDIFEAPENPEKLNKDIQFYKDLCAEHDEEDLKDSNGLISESKLRGDLKSWSVSWT